MSGPAIGLGCASMGSRKSVAESLAALERAYDAGIRWFDVAPSYGDGAAEEVLGRFASVGRPDITIATKVGILPGRVSLPKRIAKPVVRLALSLAPGLRNAVKRQRPAAEKQPITPELIAASIDASLRRLRTERLDLVLLHDATPEEAARDDIVRALERVLSGGKAARVGIASSPTAVAAGLSAHALYTVAQFANNPFQPGLSELRPVLEGRPDVMVVTHSVFGIGDMAAQLTDAIGRSPELAATLAEAGCSGSAREAATAFLADYALCDGRVATVLMSMFSRQHLAANLARRDTPKNRDALLRAAQMIKR